MLEMNKENKLFHFRGRLDMRSHFYRTMVIVASIWATIVQAKTYYLATTGDDRQDGSSNAPWATFNHAIFILQPGDTLLVREGLYEEGEIWIRKERGMGGANGRFVTLMAYPGETVRLDGARRMIVDADYVRIQGLTFLHTYSLDFPWWGSPNARNHAEILDNRFIGSFSIPLEFCGNNSIIAGNIIENQNGESHAIYLHYGRNNIVRGNRILGTQKYGIHVYDEHKSEDPPGFVREYHNILIEDNYISDSKTRAGIILGTSADNRSFGVVMDSVTIRRNTIVANAAQGILVKCWAGRIEHVDICNNTLYKNGEGIRLENAHSVNIFNNIIIPIRGFHIYNNEESTNVTALNNLYWQSPLRLIGVTDSKAIVADPLFVRTKKNNFELQFDSPARKAGRAVAGARDGTAPDIGAHETQ